MSHVTDDQIAEFQKQAADEIVPPTDPSVLLTRPEPRYPQCQHCGHTYSGIGDDYPTTGFPMFPETIYDRNHQVEIGLKAAAEMEDTDHLVLSGQVSPEAAASLRKRIQEWPWITEHNDKIFFNPCETVHVEVSKNGYVVVDVQV
jgi:hypothetical protein